jgi:hypothetical protein
MSRKTRTRDLGNRTGLGYVGPDYPDMCPGQATIDFSQAYFTQYEAATYVTSDGRTYWNAAATRLIVDRLFGLAYHPLSESGRQSGEVPRASYCFRTTVPAPGGCYQPDEMVAALLYPDQKRVWADARALWPVDEGFAVSVYAKSGNDWSWLPNFSQYGSYLDPQSAYARVREILDAKPNPAKCQSQNMDWDAVTCSCVAKAVPEKPSETDGGKTDSDENETSRAALIAVGIVLTAGIVTYFVTRPKVATRVYARNLRRKGAR